MSEPIVVGVSHKTTPIALRERLAVSLDDLADALGQLCDRDSVGEAVLLCTCNRAEVYAVSAHPTAAMARIEAFFVARGGAAVAPHLYRHLGEDAVRHLFRVTASLDSMVLGEAQILGQVKEAYEAAKAARATGPVLARAMHRAFGAAKRVRTETGIGRGTASMSTAAVELARKIFGSLDHRTVVLVGAGEMGELAARALLEQGAGRLLVANRSADRAARVAAAVGGEATTLGALPILLETADVVLSSTGAPGFALDRAMVAEAMHRRRQRPLFLIDLAVPRDIDPEVLSLPEVYLYDVDDLDRVVEGARQERSREAERAEQLVALEVDEFLRWSRGRSAVPVIAAIRARAQDIAAAEARRTLASIGAVLGERHRQSVEAMARAIANKILHAPTVRLRGEAQDDGLGPLADAAAELFALDVPDLAPARSVPGAANEDEAIVREAADEPPTERGDSTAARGADWPAGQQARGGAPSGRGGRGR